MGKQGVRCVSAVVSVLICAALFISSSFAQFNHPELKWKIVQTSHFLIHYHQNEENFARHIAEIAEELYKKLTTDIGYHPTKKIPVVIENYNDETGGYTSIFTNKIVIQAQSDPSRTSGTLPWAKEVLGHELTHYISFAAIDESIIPLRKAMANLTVPMWFVEGLAQYLGEEWHSLKDMVVGDQARENRIMSEGDLGAFYFFTGWGRMSGYYQSDNFIRYIFETYGKDKISKVFDNLREQPLLRVVGVVDTAGGGALYPLPRFVNFNQALKAATGKDSIQLYEEWRNWVIKKYEEEKEEDAFLKEPLISFGRRSQSPRISPDGNYIAFVSNKRYDFAIFDLYLFNLSTKKVKKLTTGVDPYFSFSPDGNFIVYSKTSFYSPERSFLSDLYQIEISTKRVKRLTFGERAFQPSFSPKGDRIVFVKKQGGNSNLYLLDLKKKKTFPLTRDKDGLTQNFTPIFSPDGEKIVFVRFEKGRRDLYLLTIKDGKMHALTEDKADDRCPVFSPDGKRIIFVSNRPISQKKDAFNLWSLELESGILTKHTGFAGGVFDPTVSSDGKKIAFSGFQRENFSIYLFPFQKVISQKFYSETENEKGMVAEDERKVIAEITPEKKPLAIKTYPYKPKINLHYIFPWFSISERESFFSLELYASDVLEKHQLMGKTYLSKNTQYELLYVNRSFTPTIWIDAYHVEGWSGFGGETYPVKVTGQAAGIYYPINEKIALELFFSQEKTNTQLFTPELELVPWEGNIKKIQGEASYFELKPVREPQTLPWGKWIKVGAEWSDERIGSDLNYLTLYAKIRDYWRLSENTSFAFKLATRKVENKKEPLLLFSLREWEDLRGYPQSFLDSLAGENLALGSLEYRFRLKKKLGGSSSFYLDSLTGALFFDAGATWRKGERLEEDNIYKDAGLEFRLRMLPFGKYSVVMRFGVAWPLDYDRRGRFFILFGGVF